MRSHACRLWHAQRHRHKPLPIPAREGDVVGLGLDPEAVPPACAERHRFFAIADAQRGAAAAMRHELPASRIGICKAREPFGRLESRKPGRLPGLDSAEERLKGKVQAAQRLLQGMAAELHELRPIGLDLGQRVLLVVVTDRLARLAPGVDALFERRVVERAVQSRPRLEPLGLSGIGVQLERDLAALHTGI